VPGKIRQLTVATADWGSALSAWPPASRVATQVVRSRPTKGRISGDLRRGVLVLRVRREPRHRFAQGTWGERTGRLEIAERPVVPLHRELEPLHGLQRIGQLINRVVGPGHGAVPAGVSCRQRVAHGAFLRALQVEELAVCRCLRQHAAPAVGVQRELRVDEIPVSRDEIARGRHFRLLIAAERNDEIARGHIAARLEREKRGGEERHFLLDVGGAAPEKVTVLLDEPEGITLPVRAVRRYDVHVRDEIDGAASAAVAAVADHQRSRLAQRQNVHVGGRKPAGDE
jgi:hypothetical protein